MNVYVALGLFLAVCTTSCDASECELGKWGKWGICTKTCGGGVQYRVRTCEGRQCYPGLCTDGKQEQSQECNEAPCCTKGRCQPKTQKKKCDLLKCKWKKTGKYEDCVVYGSKCVKYAKWKCRCSPKGCKGSCPGSPPPHYKPCKPDKCCICDTKTTGHSRCAIENGKCVKYAEYSCNCTPQECGSCGNYPNFAPVAIPCLESECCKCGNDMTGYSSCDLDNGKCVKYAEYSCNCTPKGCGSCGNYPALAPVPIPCQESECCECNTNMTGYSNCAIEDGKCVKHAEYSCHCTPQGCGSCENYPTMAPVVTPCPESECCECTWSNWEDCKKGKHGCKRKRQCDCMPFGCKGECEGKDKEGCEYCQ